MNHYKTLFYMVWFIRVNGYFPTATELTTFIPITKHIGIQSIAYGLATAGFDGTVSPWSFVPVTTVVPAAFDFILSQPTCNEKAIVAALVGAGATTIGSMIQITGSNGVQINLAAGTFLYAIAQFLADPKNNGTGFVSISYSPHVTHIQLQGAVYYVIVFYVLIMAALILKFCITFVKYVITKIKYEKYQKTHRLKLIKYLKSQTKHRRFIKDCNELLNKNNSI